MKKARKITPLKTGVAVGRLKAELVKLRRLVLKQEKELAASQSLIDRDHLTGLYNRRGFIQKAEQFVNEIRHNDHPDKRRFQIKNFSIIFVDLDNLKKVNDIYGHKAGDQFICLAAGTLKMHLREIDIIARWGGDEFVIGLINVSEKEAAAVAEKLKKKIELINIDGVHVKFGASFGVISAKDHHEQISNLYELIEEADLAMYEAKQAKKRGFITHYIEKLVGRKKKLPR